MTASSVSIRHQLAPYRVKNGVSLRRTAVAMKVKFPAGHLRGAAIIWIGVCGLVVLQPIRARAGIALVSRNSVVLTVLKRALMGANQSSTSTLPPPVINFSPSTFFAHSIAKVPSAANAMGDISSHATITLQQPTDILTLNGGGSANCHAEWHPDESNRHSLNPRMTVKSSSWRSTSRSLYFRVFGTSRTISQSTPFGAGRVGVLHTKWADHLVSKNL